MSNNFFDQPPGDPPVPREDDYGNVVPLSKKKKDVLIPEGWRAEWHISEAGSPLPNLFNAMVCMRRYMRDLVSFDQMQCHAVINEAPPGTKAVGTYPRAIRDADIIAIQEEMQRQGLRRVAKATVQDAVDTRAGECFVHPLRNILNGLKWDGTQRISGWLGRYLGVEGSAYSDAIGKLFLIALVARVLSPGCKADYMLILEGPQGALKSSACRVLAGDWFSDNLPDLSRGDSVRLSMHLRGKWLIEIAEMSSFNAAEAHTLKEFITQTSERYTPKYGRNEVNEPRQCLFIGSTNESVYLRDATGARRFWPIKVGEIDLEALKVDRDQLIAEAVHRFRDGEPWWPERDFETNHIMPEQESRFEEDVWISAVHDWASKNYVNKCTVVECARNALNLEIGRIGTREQRRVSTCLTKLGFVLKRSGSARWYVRSAS